MSRRIAIGTALLLSLACVFNVEVVEQAKSARFDDGGWTTFKAVVDDLDEPMTVIGTLGGPIVADAIVRAWLPPSVSASEFDEVELLFAQSGDILELTARYDGPYVETFSFASLAISTPAVANLDLNVGNSDLSVIGMSGTVRAESTTGDLNLTTRGKVAVDSLSGDLVIEVGGGGSIDTGGAGDVTVRVTDGQFDSLAIDAGGGEVIVNLPGGVGFDLVIHATEGTIRMEANVTSGAISVDTGDEETPTTESFDGRIGGGGALIDIDSNGDVTVRD